MSDGSRLRQSWSSALLNAEGQFRSLLLSSNSSVWKKVPLHSTSTGSFNLPSPKTTTNSKGNSRLSWPAENMIMHRKQTKDGDVIRVMFELPYETPVTELDKWKAILVTPDVRSEWDPSVESSSLVEMFDWNTRIARTNYTLGWPANPRDTVTISKTYFDGATLIDISTSLPRSPDEPAYLRPAPPYVRSHLHLFAWCIQQHSKPPSGEEQSNKIRVTCFWQHDFKTLWALNTHLMQHLPVMVQGLVRLVRKRGHRIPMLSAYGTGVVIEHMAFETGREALTVEYAILNEDDDGISSHSVKDLAQVNEIKAKKRLEHTIEYALPDVVGWDVQLSTRASSEAVANLPWQPLANRLNAPPGSAYTTLSIRHSSLPDNTTVLKVKLTIELSGGATGLRINGLSHPITQGENRDPLSYTLSQQMLQDTSSVGELSFRSLSTRQSGDTQTSTISTATERGINVVNRNPAVEKLICAKVRRNYIYFSSLLQEPEAKWKQSSEARGVTISQLDSIDPTLVVYRAEAVFVGVGLWDLFSVIVSPGARVYWDKVYEDATLLQDVNELTELWHWRSKFSWPVNARDAVVLKTVYKSPTTIHVFSFSTDDSQLFPSLPPVDPNVIRTQVDLQGWAIEVLSPTTTLVTLLEQSDPRGWSGKSSIPQQMISAVAGVGEYAIKCGGPPVNTRIANARCVDARYDHEKGSFRLEYESFQNRSSQSTTTDISNDPQIDDPAADAPSQSTGLNFSPSDIVYIECEIRCDLETWAQSLEIVVDPPPQTVSCLRRHKLSREGGGLWLTICHNPGLVDGDRLLVIVRKGSTKDKGAVMLNGAKIKVDIEELPEKDVKVLMKMKRTKPPRIPLDQPPVLGLIKRRREEWNDESENDAQSSPTFGGVIRWAVSAPRIPSPLNRFWSMAVEHTSATTAAAVTIASNSLGLRVVDEVSLPPSRPPMSYALSALSFLQNLDTRSISEDWLLISSKGVPIYKKTYPELSPNVPVHRSCKVIEGISAEEITQIVDDTRSRSLWDSAFDSSQVLQTFGNGAYTAFRVHKGGFPFRSRGFYVAHITGRLLKSFDSLSPGQRTPNDSLHPSPTTIFCASASFNPNGIEASLDPVKYNPQGFPIGQVLIEGWILETLDPYTTENYAIPSTKCTYVSAVDYAGSIPIAYNSMLNASLPRVILSIEQSVKASAGFPLIRLPPPAMAIMPNSEESAAVSNLNSTSSRWILEDGDNLRSLIYQDSDATTKKFQIAILVSSRIADLKTPRLPLTFLQNTSPIPSNFSPNISLNSSPISTVRSRTVSTPSRSLTLPLLHDGLRAVTASVGIDAAAGSLDVIIGEIVLDTKLYFNGYIITAKSLLRNATTTNNPISLSSLSSSSNLPILCSCHELPATPSHSSGLNTDISRRQLLRFTFPTAQYDNTNDDPLSLQSSARPAWLSDLETYGAIVEISISPVENKTGKYPTVFFNGSNLEIMKEKDSSRLLRKELDNERLGYLPRLSRISNSPGDDEIPKTLIEPLGLATALSFRNADADLPSAPGLLKIPTTENHNSVRRAPSGDFSDTVAAVSQTQMEQAEVVPQTSLLRFLNGYQSVLFRRPNQNVDGSYKSASGTSTPSNPESKFGQIVVTQTPARRLYPLSTVLFIGLISFLIGSLLRSLLTPADFIYVSKDLSELENDNKGWREIKRLVEVKQIFWGWDFLVGVVRRH